MMEPEHASDEVDEYECFNCGEIVVAASNPGSCPECAAGMRNRRYPIE